MNEIRVPSKVLKLWQKKGAWWCALDDGRLYYAKEGKWTPFVAAVEDR